MAKRVYNIFPIDLEERKAVGVSIPFSGKAVFNSTYTTKDQIKSNLINYFLTNKGERLYQPLFGGNLKKYLFEPLSDELLFNIKKQIQEDLKLYFPKINLEKIEVLDFPNENKLQIIIDYRVINFGINDTINLIIN